MRSNPSLIQNTAEAQRAVEQAISTAEEQFYRNTVDARGKASIGLALMDPYSAFEGIARVNARGPLKNMVHLTAEDREIS